MAEETDGAGSSSNSKGTAQLALAISIVSLLVAFFGNASNIFAFFGQVTPMHASARNNAEEAFVRAIASSDQDDLYTQYQEASPGSPAQTFAYHYYWILTARSKTSGWESPQRETSRIDGGWQMCDKDEQAKCVKYTNFRFDDEDRVSDASRQNERLETWIAALNEGGNAKGVTGTPLAGRVYANSDTSEYAVRLRNTSDEAVEILGCLNVDTIDGETHESLESEPFPITLESWQEFDLYCRFDTSNLAEPLYIGVQLTGAEWGETLWVTFDD
jgi:hypothetical protein